MSFFNVVFQAKSFCAHCGARSTELMQCPCQQVHYCSTQCQLEHWAVHKLKCPAARKGQPTLRSCANCAVTSLHLKACPCGTVLYCSVACQRAHWGVHRKMCSSWVSTYRRPPITKDAETQTDESSAERIAEEKEKRGAASINVSVYVDEITQKQGGGISLKKGGKHHLSRRSISVVRPLANSLAGEGGTNDDAGGNSVKTVLSEEELARSQHEAQMKAQRSELEDVETAKRDLLAQQEESSFNSTTRELRNLIRTRESQFVCDAEKKARALILAEYSAWSRRQKPPLKK